MKRRVSENKDQLQEFVHLVGSFTYCSMMHGTYNVKLSNIFTFDWHNTYIIHVSNLMTVGYYCLLSHSSQCSKYSLDTSDRGLSHPLKGSGEFANS